MRKFLIIGACIAGVAIVAAMGGPCKHSSSNPGHEHSSSNPGHESSHQEWLKWLKDAKIEVTNTGSGAMINFTSTDPAMVKKIQEFAPKLAECLKAGTCPLREKAQEEVKKVEKAQEQLLVREVTEAEVGKEAVCPVMNEKFKVNEETEAVDYRGKTYYFCCPDCAPKFTKEPAKYIEK